MDAVSSSEELIRTVSEIPDRLGANACFGAPVEKDGHTLIPVARISFGYGLGFGRGTGSKQLPSANGYESGDTGEGEGGGGGGGGSSSPVAVIDISRDDVTIKPIFDTTRIRLSGMMVGAWVSFWLLSTLRTVVRERARVRKVQIEHSAAEG